MTAKPEKDKEKDSRWPRPRKGPPRDWESAVEKSIREAMERGEFEKLPGAGKPLDLRRDPNTPEDLELAFKLLRDAGFAPDWIEQDKEIRAGRAKLREPFQKYLARAQPAVADRAEREAHLIAEFRQEAAELNRQIDLFNLKAPSVGVHHARIRIEEEVDRFKRAFAGLEKG